MAKYIASYGRIPSYTGYFQYPSAFIISATFSSMLGIPTLETNMILFSCVNLLIVLLLFIVGKVFVRGKWNWLVPLIYFVVVFEYHTGGLHYAPQFIGLCFYILFVYISMKLFQFQRVFQWKVILIILLSVLVTTHIFSTVFTLTTIFIMYLLGVKAKYPFQLKKEPAFTLFIFGLGLFFSWHMFVANEVFKSTIEFIPLILKGFRMASEIEKTMILAAPPGLIGRLLQLYRYGVYALFGLMSMFCLIKFRYEREVKLIFGFIVGLSLGLLLVYFTPALFGVSRIFFFGGIFVSILSSYLIVNEYAQKSKVKAVLGLFIRIVPLLVIITFLVQNMYISSYNVFIHPDEVNACIFVTQRVKGEISVIVSQAHIIRFYGEFETPMFTIDPAFISAESAQKAFESEDFSLQNLLRNEYYFGFGFVENMDNLIYSNGLNRIYSKT